ncbi:actinin-like protein [Lichtheimia corymbifera JMRC:FSU:9682]|uniref:Actinin-like protein n=1 Tax=Lichtheimia corymbifera JMRC:FSU:9682 TaxID=1263082 RepID=A0A068RGZ7_9FUNG|nr:actinin-like protein [Lichtheimia corymbifera JMRC:FSU:9682]
MDTTWLTIQAKTFTKWQVCLNLDLGRVPHIVDLKTDLSNGVRLIQLLEIISGTQLGRYSMNPRMRIQCVENVNKALNFIMERGVPLTNIGAEDIVDKNLKLVLGMLWMIILRFTIADINQDGKNAKEGLLLWCQRKTSPYKEVQVKDFTGSWKDGLAFCALIHRHRPDLLNFYELDFSKPEENTQLAFDIAEEYLGIPKLLDVEDVCNVTKPDERSIMTYVAQYFHAFSSQDKDETAGRRVSKFADVLNSIWQSKNYYEERAFKLIEAVQSAQKHWKETVLTDSYQETKQKGLEFATYKSTQKREWVSERRDLDTLLGNIQTKLKTYNLKPYFPPEGLTLKDLDNMWQDLLNDEAVYYRNINSKMREIKENLRKAYAQAANSFQRQLDAISADLAALDGDLEHQMAHVGNISHKLSPLQKDLEHIEVLDRACIEANTEENDYTVYSVEDLTFELGLVKRAIRKKMAFIENQSVSRNMTNLTPAQLEEFEHVFRHFANDQSNTLSIDEFPAALASLGLFYDDYELDRLFAETFQHNQEASFEQFIQFMVAITEDKSTPEQLQDAFQTIAGDKPYVTELDLRRCMVPETAVEYLSRDMPPATTSDEPDSFDYSLYVKQMFQ